MKEFAYIPTGYDHAVFASAEGLTAKEQTPYAKRGSALMHNDSVVDLVERPIAVPVKPGDKEKEAKEKKEIEENPRLKALERRVDEVKEKLEKKKITDWTEAELRHDFALLHRDLSGVKMFTSPRVFLRALTLVGPYENIIRRKLEEKHVDTKKLRDSLLSDVAKKERSSHVSKEDISQQRKVALRHMWERFYTREELNDPKTQLGIDTAIEAGYLPITEVAPDEGAKRELEKQRRLLEKAEQVMVNANLDDTQRKQKARELLLKRHPEFASLSEAAWEKIEQAVITAHEVGSADPSKGVYAYSLEDIREKYDALEKVRQRTIGKYVEQDENDTPVLSKEDIRELMETGLVGRGRGGRAREITIEEELASIHDPDERAAQKELLDQIYGRNVQDDWFAQMHNQADEIEQSLHDRIDAADQAALEALLSDRGALEGSISRIGANYAKRNAEISSGTYVDMFQKNFEGNLQAAREALAAGNLEEAKRLANDVAHQVGERDRQYWNTEQRYRERVVGNENLRTINNFEDVLDEIIEFDPDTYGDEGENPLYKTEIRDGNRVRVGVNQGNFKKWVQDRMVYHSSFDPDAPIQFFSAVALENTNLYRPVSLAQMVGSYSQFFRLRDGKTVLTDLKDEIVDMGWIDGYSRNTDVNYRQGMTNDSKFGDLMVDLFKSNVFGKESQRSGINTLASMFMTDADFDPDKKAGEGDMKIGIATESAFLFYYNMTDYKELRELFEDSLDVYFSYDQLQSAITEVMRSNSRDPFDNVARKRFIEESGLAKTIMPLFDRKVHGELRIGTNAKGEKDGFILDSEKGTKIQAENITKYLLEMNLFDPPMKNRFANLVTRAMVKRVAGAESGLNDDRFEEGLGETMRTRGTLDYAEMRGFWLTHPLGAAAKQDVAYSAINAMTKVVHFQKYLNKQANPGRAGGIGNPLEYPLLREIAADPVTGILTDKNVSTLEMIKDLHNIRRDKTKSEAEKRASIQRILSEWTYKDLAWKQYAPQHMANAFKEFHDRTSGKEIHIDQFASFDIFGHVVYDHAKMISEVQEGLIKPSRYRWATHKLRYDEMRRRLVSQKEDNIIYEDSALAEEMYGPQVLLNAVKMQLHEYEELLKHGSAEDKENLRARGYLDANGRLKPISAFIDSKGRFIRQKDASGEEQENQLTREAKELLASKDFGRVVTKAYLMSKFAVQLYSVSHMGTGHKRLDFQTRELIIATLGHIPAGIHGDDYDFSRTHLTEFYFNDFDLNLMRKMSGNELWRNFLRAAGGDTALGGADALKQILKQFFKNILKV